VRGQPVQMALRAIFVINLILGIIFWTGNAASGLVFVHALLGITFVALLFWVGAAQAMRGGSLGITLSTFVVGLALAIVGLTQARIGGLGIQIVHVLLAVLAIGLAEMAGARANRVGTRTA